MSGCHNPTYNNCNCPCHGIKTKVVCICSCSTISLVFTNVDASVFNSAVKRIEELVEEWKKTEKISCDRFKKPSGWPVCDGSSKRDSRHAGVIECPSCRGKGIVWG
jgi:hypothetical protein